MITLKEKVGLAFKGFFMGIAHIIPGVSGGTIAFLLGIYEELIESIASFDLVFIKRLLKGRVGEAFRDVKWQFLLTICIGSLIAIFSMSSLMRWLLTDYKVYVNAFFFGLILTTVMIITQNIRKGDFAKLTVGLLSAVAMYYSVGMAPINTPETWWFLFLCGAIAVCTMILPGISGSFVLLLLGKYEFIIAAVSDRNMIVLVAVAAGCIFGIFTFVRFLRLVLHRYYDLTLSVLAGLVLGSLRKVWPWKVVAQEIVTSHERAVLVKEINILPAALNLEVMLVFIFFLVGIFLSFYLAGFDKKK